MSETGSPPSVAPPSAPRPANDADSARRQLAAAVRATDPAAFLVPSRILRRVIRERVDVSGLSIALPHRKSFVIRGDELLPIVGRDELGLESGDPMPPDPVILVSEPSDEALEFLSARELLRRTWRLLYHARIHAAYDVLVEAGSLQAGAVRERIERIGQTAFDEIRSVLRQEVLLLPPRDDRSVFVEFAAFFLDTLHFAPHLLPHYFPGIVAPDDVRALIAEDVDERGLLAATRPLGAPAPADADLRHEEERWERALVVREPEPRPSARRRRGIVARAERASAAGNCVRAAILFRRAALKGVGEAADRDRARADAEMDRLHARLVDALSIPPEERPAWRAGLAALLPRTGARSWTREARMLYDFQKVCVDHERGVFTIDPVEFVLTLGRRPVRRWLPSEREALENRHLRSALRRLPALRLPPEIHESLQPVLRRAVEEAEERLRTAFRPRILAAFREVRLFPDNLPERIAQAKIVEELLDRAVARGRLRMGDIRDAISRNDLKLPDVKNPLRVFFHDPLLRLDRKLAVSLDGVYRRAEFYLRWLQRLSALALGTAVGRFLVKYIVLPFGGAFVVLEGLQHIVADPVAKLVGAGPVHLLTPVSWVLVGTFFFQLMHAPPFRWVAMTGLRAFGRGLKYVFWTLPGYVARLPAVARLLASRPFLLAARFVLKPAIYCALIFGAFRLFGSESPKSWREAIVAFFATAFLVNIPVGRRIEEITWDRLARNLHRFRVRVLAGFYQFVVGFFRGFLDAVDRFLYAVDEWLRFRSGESRLSLVVKPIVGVAWFLVSYIIRLYTTLLVEPQVNPIKHFPVVTVAHKVTLPMALPLTRFFSNDLLVPIGLPVVAANTIAGTTVLLMPGIFGFLVWELKENWKLFAGNRAKKLKPELIGHHGETMLRLMKPGFHSGTLPKLFARLRRAERKAWRAGSDRRIRKLLSDLHHVEESLRRFIDREFLPLLERSAAGRYSVGEIRLGSNRIRIEVTREGSSRGPLVVVFEEQAGWLLGSTPARGFYEDLSPSEREHVRNALAGLYKRAGVELVREQVRIALGRSGGAYDVAEDGIVHWPGDRFEIEMVYPLRGVQRMKPRQAAGPAAPLPPELEPDDVLLSRTPITWKQWAAAWDRQADEQPPRLLPGIRLV